MYTAPRTMRLLLVSVSLVMLPLMLTGCPTVIVTPQAEYDRGFDNGFTRDDYYWDGYYDGYDTVSADPFYYDTSGIPYLDALTYDAGYYDGVWYAYNDGYFVDYRYAFILGFSEGYDNAYAEDYLAFLASDQHTELLNGGWADGYNDGFSEGRIFGAYDYETALPFDWQSALVDYESGLDLYFQEIDLGTGADGPVVLYAYGTDPSGAKAAPLHEAAFAKKGRSIRATGEEAKAADVQDRELYRSLKPETIQELSVTPTTSQRNARALRLTTSWLDRIDSYLQQKTQATPSQRGTPTL